MKILYLRSNPVNPDSRVEKEVTSLTNAGHEVEIFAWDRNSKFSLKTENLIINNQIIEIHRVGIESSYGGGMKKNLIPLLKFQIEIVRFLLKNIKKYDVIHACDFDTAFTSNLILKMFKNKKFVYDIFDFYVDAFSVPTKLKNIIKKLDYSIINNADAVIICSEQRKEQISGSKPKILEIIHNTPLQIAKFKSMGLNDSKIKIVYVGILAEYRFIKEMADFVINNDEFEFHIGGFGLLEEYFKILADNHSNIFYYGKLTYFKTLELEANCDIIPAVYDPKIPNHYYAAPNKFYEALMLGKPLIMAKNTGMDEIVLDERIGVVIDFTEESLSKGLNILKEESKDWECISSKMKKIYKSQYSWNIMDNRLKAIYEKLN